MSSIITALAKTLGQSPEYMIGLVDSVNQQIQKHPVLKHMLLVDITGTDQYILMKYETGDLLIINYRTKDAYVVESFVTRLVTGSY